MIVHLCKHVGNLEILIQNESLMQLLSRLLEHEYAPSNRHHILPRSLASITCTLRRYKSSLEMTYNIIRIFLAFSNFIEMHSLLTQYKVSLHLWCISLRRCTQHQYQVGSLTLKVIEYETKRVSQRVHDLADMKEKEKQLTVQANSQALVCDNLSEKLCCCLDGMIISGF